MVNEVSIVKPDLVLVVDCQTTGSSPETGHLLEVAWALLVPSSECSSRSIGEPEVFSFLVALPEGEEVPRRISRITGITDDMLRGAPAATEVGHLLAAWVKDAMPVAHFAAFEQRWFDSLMRMTPGAGDRFPKIVCTRELARRLYPGLPRKGLRAVAGYLGHSLRERRRAADHVRATAGIWRRMLSDLGDIGVRTSGELEAFISSSVPVHEGSWDYLLPREKRLSLPVSPGTYRFYAADGRILYAGTARSLRSRVNSYFTKRKADSKTLELVSQVADLEISECATPLEAALEEFLLIREHTPQYNIALRERGLHLVHLDMSFGDPSEAPDQAHPVGPLPSGSPAMLLGDLLDTVLAGGIPDPVCFGLNYLPMADGALEEGTSLFREEYISAETTLRDLLRSGTEVWLRRAVEEEEPDQKHAEDNGIAPVVDALEEVREPSTLISADRVLRNLEWVLAAGARDLRTAAWFRLLGWSHLYWRPHPDSSLRRLAVSGGTLCGRWFGEPEETHPAAPGRWERQAAIDPDLYDLLRVLQSELRRISSSGLPLRVMLPTGRTIEGEGLGRLLSLV